MGNEIPELRQEPYQIPPKPDQPTIKKQGLARAGVVEAVSCAQRIAITLFLFLRFLGHLGFLVADRLEGRHIALFMDRDSFQCINLAFQSSVFGGLRAISTL